MDIAPGLQCYRCGKYFPQDVPAAVQARCLLRTFMEPFDFPSPAFNNTPNQKLNEKKKAIAPEKKYKNNFVWENRTKLI